MTPIQDPPPPTFLLGDQFLQEYTLWFGPLQPPQLPHLQDHSTILSGLPYHLGPHPKHHTPQLAITHPQLPSLIFTPNGQVPDTGPYFFPLFSVQRQIQTRSRKILVFHRAQFRAEKDSARNKKQTVRESHQTEKGATPHQVSPL